MYDPPDTLRRISSRITFVTKYISPVVTLFLAVGFLSVLLGSPLRDGLPMSGLVLLFVVGITAYHLWTSYRIKTVKADSRNLYVKDYFKETTIPLDQIADVTEFRFVEPRVVTIHLSSPSEFGSKIAFLAPYFFFGGWGPHPIVDELQRMAGHYNWK